MPRTVFFDASETLSDEIEKQENGASDFREPEINLKERIKLSLSTLGLEFSERLEEALESILTGDKNQSPMAVLQQLLDKYNEEQGNEAKSKTRGKKKKTEESLTTTINREPDLPVDTSGDA